MRRLEWSDDGLRAYTPAPWKKNKLVWGKEARPMLFARITFYPTTGKWHVLTCDFETTDLPCVSYQTARDTIEALFACES